jgi:hypothetical protein
VTALNLTALEWIMRLAAHPDGMRVTSVPQEMRDKVANVASRRVASGKLYRVRLSHRNVRYFLDLRNAAQYEERNRNPGGGKGVVIKHSRRAGWGPDDPMHITEQTKRTDCPPLRLSTTRSGWGVSEFIGWSA